MLLLSCNHEEKIEEKLLKSVLQDSSEIVDYK